MTDTDITRRLAAWTVALRPDDIPEAVRREGVRTFVNWLGCALGGARHETVDRAIAALAPFSGPARAQVLGRSERLDELHAALMNGISSHVLDYDDTHLKTIIHPAGPVASAILAVAEARPVTGEAFLAALVAGVEVECRIGNAVYPEHYDRGWHITGTTGVFGAAAAVGRLLDLDERQMTWAYGIAATQSSGFREMFGTMCKSFHPGRAAQNGAAAAFLAKANFDSSLQAIEAPRGWANVLSTKQDYGEIVDDLGTRWEAKLNSYKPYACGIVIHPAIDGCSQLRERLGERVTRIRSVELGTHYLVLELTGKRTPQTGLESKFSVYHAAAVALLHGDGTPTAFTDERARDPEIIALRDRVQAKVEPGIEEDAVRIAVTLEDGERIELHVEHAIGSLERPLSDEAITEKFRRQAEPVVGADTAARAIEAGWALAGTGDAGAIARLCAA
ncbi:MmgE/PrpD family protein [Aureimonas jatrophae]|uniref:2-methylcitrate dehydratase PrpD n=1 Tax=Aureimonas jatrophae TaxID=1166073 RepID=A0A1H0FQK9_9HYPH|nr:MmgE/PrpD family protein [Aureimonas jatrophae]MBB3949912.1 2-methylcitrate dehydratase PrpD [Aureimonas jatrophae]SDN96759.1 2-methylcitrate dehydratase PrpD [Aureimonas jatrophae]